MTEATERASAAEKAASDRVLQLEQETADRLGSIEKAYEMLKRSDRERLETMQREVEQLRRDNENLVNETKNLKEKLSSSESIVAQATAQMEAMQQKLEERLDIMQRGAKLNKEGSENLDESMRASARVASEESVRQEIMDQIAGVEQLMARSSERSNSRMEALRFCVTSSGRERDYWRARAMRAEEKEKAMQLEMKRANSSLKGSDVEARRMLTTLSASARRRLYAGGTRSEVTGGETSQVINSGWIPEDG